MRRQPAPPATAADAVRPAPSVIGRVIAVLGLFAPQRLSIDVDDIASALALSSASAYRYASELLGAGLLARGPTGYRLGPKIIELEYLIRAYDPIINAGEAVMHALSERTGHDVLLSNVYGDTVVNVLHVAGRRPVRLTYTKGLPMPLFRGAQAKVALAYMDRRRLRRLFDRALSDATLAADVRRIGADWRSFTAVLRRIRLQGCCIARAELDTGVVGIAAPVVATGDRIVGSIVVTLDARETSDAHEAMLAGLVIESAAAISRRLASPAGDRAAPAS